LQTGESFNEYLERLRELEKPCAFSDKDNELKSQIIQGCISDKLRRRALEDESLDLSKIINLGRTLESVESHLKEMGC
jgi:hypothetical protein